MHTRSGRDVSPVRANSPSNSDEEADVGRGRGRGRLAARKVPNSKARGGLAESKVPNSKAGQASSSKGRTNIPVKKSPMKKVPNQQGMALNM